MLESDGLAAAVRDATQQRRTSIMPTQDTVPVDWDRVAKVANSYLGENFGPPPWSGLKWAVLRESLRTRWQAGQKPSKRTSWTAMTDFSSTGVLVVTSTNPRCHLVA